MDILRGTLSVLGQAALSVATVVVPVFLWTSGYTEAAKLVLLLYVIGGLGVVVAMTGIMWMARPRRPPSVHPHQ
jgi:hypothetical protein